MKKKGKKENRIIKFLYNPWVISIAFYVLGLLTPSTIATFKELNFIKKETNNIDVVGSMYVNNLGGGDKNLFFFFTFLLIIVLLLFILIINLFNDDDEEDDEE